MFGSSMLDIAIGVVFIFLLLSIFATAVNEYILSRINLRGTELLRGIQTLLSDKDAVGLAKNVYEHGQIFGLYQGEFTPREASQSRWKSLKWRLHSDLPSYIPSRNFAIALLDSVQQNYASPVAPAVPPPQLAPPPAVSTPEAATLATMVKIVPIPQTLRNAAEALAKTNPKVGRPVLAMITLAGDDASKLQKNVEDWFNSSMDRVSGWYKYHTQKTLFCIGLIMAIALNANTINIVRQLSTDSTLRQTIVTAARTAAPAQPQKPSAQDPSLDDQIQAATKAFGSLNGLGIPLGWPRGAPVLIKLAHHPLTCSEWSDAWAAVWTAPFWEAPLGWILTAIAISLGAPFWFDSLNKIMVIRSTVKPQEKSKDEESKS